MTAAKHPPKVATGDNLFSTSYDAAVAADEVTAKAAGSGIFDGWRMYATAVGQSGPGHINRAQRAIRAIKGSTR